MYVNISDATNITIMETKYNIFLLMAWIEFKRDMDKYYIHHEVWNEIIYPFQNFNSATVDVREWKSNSNPAFAGM